MSTYDSPLYTHPTVTNPIFDTTKVSPTSALLILKKPNPSDTIVVAESCDQRTYAPGNGIYVGSSLDLSIRDSSVKTLPLSTLS